MITGNPFAELAILLSPRFMQIYIILLIFAAVAGTVFDVLHKRSGVLFARQRQKSNETGTKPKTRKKR